MKSQIGADAFLTAFDPIDLPGNSVDPLGFDRAYGFLADRILPGLTNVADQPRYFGLLAAGVLLAGEVEEVVPRRRYERRRDCLLRFERLWALANVLAAEAEQHPLAGLRGVTYARAERERLARAGASNSDGKFDFLKRQGPYGVLGIYGAIGVDLRIVRDGGLLELTPDLGCPLGEAFLEETEAPSALRRAVSVGDPVRLNVLTDWGRRALLGSIPGPKEAACLADALHASGVRLRMARYLTAVREPQRGELARLSAIGRAMSATVDDADLAGAVQAILSFERCYALVALALERTLWRCSRHPFRVTRDELGRDDVLLDVVSKVPDAARRFTGAIECSAVAAVPGAHEHLRDVRQFLERAANAADPAALAAVVRERHAEVQRGKFDGGRRKAPWLEETSDGMALAPGPTGNHDVEPLSVKDIRPHPYRLSAADNLIAAARTR